MSNRYERIRSELSLAENSDPATSLTHLRSVLVELTDLIDEQLASAVLDEELSLRSAAEKVGLSENALGPRLARTSSLKDYARPDGRVTAKEVQRARFEKQAGINPTPNPDVKQPMRFKPRRPT